MINFLRPKIILQAKFWISWSLQMFLLEVLPHMLEQQNSLLKIRALIINLRFLLSGRCLILFIRCSLYKQLEDSLDIWLPKVTAVSIQTPKSFTTGEGLMFFPNSRTGGKDKFHVNCGTPTTKSLVLSGLVNREFVEHHFRMWWRSLLRSEMATLISDGGSAKSS